MDALSVLRKAIWLIYPISSGFPYLPRSVRGGVGVGVRVGWVFRVSAGGGGGRVWYCPGTSEAIRGLYSLGAWTSYRMISGSLTAARFGFRLSNCCEIWQAPRQPHCLDSCQTSQRYIHHSISRLRRVTGSYYGNTSCCLINYGNRDPGR